jgi:hypothetical protein
MKFRLLLFLSLLALSTLACALIGSGGDDSLQDVAQPDQPADAQQPTADPGSAPASTVLFQDDFSDVNSGWDRVNVTEGVTDYANGAYRIFVDTAETDVWANPNLDFNDVRIEVDATKVGGSDNNDYGLQCRYVDSENFYFFIISSDGYYGVGKVKDGVQVLIGSDNMPPSDKIITGDAGNRIMAECVGSTLRMYVNGALLTEVNDGDFASGDVGLIAGSFDESGVDIYFDNLIVYAP